jgi:hypothetical protein
MRQYLTDEEVADVLRYVGCHVVLDRPNGTGAIYENTSQHLRGSDGGRPLAEYLSMREVTANEIAAATAKPVSMAG